MLSDQVLYGIYQPPIEQSDWSVVPVKVASPVAVVQVGYILWCILLCYLHEPRGLWPSVM